MAEESAIGWTRSTFNPWVGCTKIGPGCDACYADVLDERRLSKTLGGGTPAVPIRHWGAGAPRYRTSQSNWNQVLRWNRQAAEEQRTGVLTPKSTWTGRVGHWPVFCASLADVFDNEVDPAWRQDLWALIRATPALSWLLVTKRIGNVPGMVPGIWLTYRFEDNVRLLITVVNQEEADRDVPKLLRLKCKNGVSYEPALGPVDWSRFLPGFVASGIEYGHGMSRTDVGRMARGVDWVIVGGESSQGDAVARPFKTSWAHQTIAQCGAAGVPVFVKQMGSRVYIDLRDGMQVGCLFRDSAGANPAEWPQDLRVQEFPG